jgi:hypothetical protein
LPRTLTMQPVHLTCRTIAAMNKAYPAKGFQGFNGAL